MPYVPFGGLYRPSRNELVEAPALNPLEPNPMKADCGDAGLDGYTVLSRANRYDGGRNLVGPAHLDPEGPRLSEDQ